MKNMKSVFTGVMLFTCFGILLCCEAFGQGTTRTTKGLATAKGPGSAAGKGAVDGTREVRLQKLAGLGRRGMIKTPEYRTSLGNTVALEKDWCQISLNYVTQPEWIDELTFQFYAVSEALIEGKKVFSFYKSAVRYQDIEKGTHVCTMYLRPSALKRFGELFAIAVEVSYKGQIIDKMSIQEGKPLGEEWWKNPKVVEDPSVIAREGYLLTRAQSPWALINTDGYEFSR